jgi:murein DD-endopeptidase MepM/ murein hydrolase activator NlpD
MKIFRLIAAAAVICILAACSTAQNAASSSAAAPGGVYTVERGDTLSSIARQFRISVHSLAALNGLKDADDIRVGQQLRVNSRRAAAAGQAKRRQSAGPAADEEESATADSGPAPRDWVWPADGIQTVSFGQKKGIEISGKSGQPVRAANDGKISFVGGGIRGYGNLVIIRHSGNLLSVYAHNKTVVVKEGQTVAKGQKIAEMGNSDSDTVKLYFEIRRNGKPVDPSGYLPAR